jgi:hypothetical protein
MSDIKRSSDGMAEDLTLSTVPTLFDARCSRYCVLPATFANAWPSSTFPELGVTAFPRV